MLSDTMNVTFWGVRGSYPMPGPSTIHYGGNTSCIEIKVAQRTIIFDAGSGIINLGRKLMQQAARTGMPVEALLCFSHYHHDHLLGFPFFQPLFSESSHLSILGPKLQRKTARDVLEDLMVPHTCPLTFGDINANLNFHTLRETDIIRLPANGGAPLTHHVTNEPLQASKSDVVIRIMRSYAHPGRILFYRLEWQNFAVVYASDTEGYVGGDQQLIRFAQGADLLIHDAQYTPDHYSGRDPAYPITQGWGHSTFEMACEVAKAASVKQLALFHYEPTYPDQRIAQIEQASCKLFPNTMAPYEGLQLSFGQPRPFHSRLVATRRESRAVLTERHVVLSV